MRCSPSRTAKEALRALDLNSGLTTERYTAVDDDEIRAAAACAW
jgi:hypothetical protein